MQGRKEARPPAKLLVITTLLSLILFGGIMERWERDLYGAKPGVYLEEIEVGSYLPHELMPILEEKAAREQTMPVEPGIDKNGQIIRGEAGISIDVEATLERILAAAPGEHVSVIRIQASPRYSENDLIGLEQTWGKYSTWYRGSLARKSNVRLACQTINYTVLWPGQIFSFNQVVGPRTAEYGYHQAPVMLDEELVPGVGGGVCQVATTLYNAVRLSALPVLERHTHSGKVNYVAKGLDAAVADGYMDLKFKNNRSSPIIIRCYTTGGRITAAIIGR
ncbi:MAG: VanW family protein [Methylocystaceae bacterium]